MEVNKEEAARCRDLGANALRQGQNARAVKMFTKSLRLYPLPGVTALLDQAKRKLEAEENGTSSNANHSQTSNSSSTSSGGFAAASRSSSTATSASASTTTGADGRAYTEAQVSIVSQVLKAKVGGQGAHYRVLGIDKNADDAAIKKAYRKLALKLHPDKNSAPHADEAFKAVGLAYATLSDGQKRRIYDLSGEEDPDNRGGGARRGHPGAHFHGQDVSPEDIFNMFFGGGMPGGMGGAGGMGGPGFRVYSSGFGPGGMAFGGMHPNMRARQQQQQQQRQRQQQQQQEGPFGQLLQLLPLFLIMLLSFWNMGEDGAGATGGSRYFSLTPVKPHTNPLSTRFSKVKDIPYYVTDQFLRTIARDRYQLSQVERMVERSYEKYLTDECKNQKAYKRKLELLAAKGRISDAERTNLVKKARGFELGRCVELEDLFPHAVPQKDRVKRHTEF